jgi:uncharacterized protein
VTERVTGVKHGPERTCVGCRGRAPQESLLRIVATANGAATDPGRSAAGRGAYVHRDAACVRLAAKPDVLARALRTGLGADELGRLIEEIETGVP